MGAKKSRKSPRAQVSLVARYRSPTAFEFVREECFDLSVGGMFIKSPAPAPAGTLLKLECDVDEGAAKIRGVARVVWLREQSVDGHPAGMGVKFVKLEPGGRDVIAGILDRLGTELDEEGEQRRSTAPPGAAVGPFQRTPSSRPDLALDGSEAMRTTPVPGAAGGAAAAALPATSSDAITVRPPGAPLAAPAVELLGTSDRSPPIDAAISEASSAGGARAVAESAAHGASPASASSARSQPAHERTEGRSLRARLEQAKQQQSSSPVPAVVPRSARGVATPAPREAAAERDAGEASRSKRPLLYAAIVLLAVGGVYTMTRRQAREPADVATPEPTMAAPEPTMAKAPEPQPPPAATAVAPAAVPAAQEAVPTSIAPAPPHYVLEVVTQPEGARVTAGAQALTAPGELDLGTLENEVAVSAELDGYESAQANVDRVGFMLDEGAMRRRLVLKLTAVPKAKAKPEPEPSARRSRRERSAERAARTPRTEPEPAKIATPVPAPEPAPPAPITVTPVPSAPVPVPLPPAPVATAKPEPKPEPEPEAKPAADEAKQRPLDAAMACLGTGDNACVIKALEGKARTAQELELLIETYRAMGNAPKAEKYMEMYVDKHPGERRASTYRRLLEHQQAESAAPAP